MPLSMRRLSQLQRDRQTRDADVRERRVQAATLLSSNNNTVKFVSNCVGLSYSTCYRIKQSILAHNNIPLTNILNPGHHRRGRKSHLSAQQESMISERLIFAAKRGFAADYQDTKHLMGRIAALCGKPYKHGTPSDDTVRSFRARHRELAYRKHECKDKAKVNTESFDHVDQFFRIIEDIGSDFPGLLEDGNRIWNMDETDVSAEFGTRVRVFSDSTSHHGGTRSAFLAGGSGRHVTIVIAASASGKTCPPFFIVEGKNVMENWIEPLPSSLLKASESPLLKRLTTQGWFPNNAVICTSERGCMNMNILSLFMKHLNHAVRKHVPDLTSFLLTIDGYASRKGVEWLELCHSSSCEAVLAPANTSHFLQPCDQEINKRFKRELRSIRDELSDIGSFDHRKIQFKLMCAILAHERITTSDCVAAFCKTGLFPFNRNFPERFKRNSGNEAIEQVEKENNREYGVAKMVREIIAKEGNNSRMLQRLSTLLNNAETTNSILMAHGRRSSGSSGSASTAMSANRAVLCCGAPAEHLTIGDAIEKKRQKVAEEKRAELEKEDRRKRKAAEKAAKAEIKRLQKEERQEAKRKRDIEKARIAAERKTAA